jgi:alanine racemase
VFHASHIELNKSAFKKNVQFLQDYIGSDVTFCSVIKGNAYGHGINTFVPMAEACGIRYFGVFSAVEAQKALQASTTGESRIMIMGMIGNDALSWAIQNGISFYIFELDRLEVAIKKARRLRTPACIHLHLETGMNRLGLDQKCLEDAVELIQANKEHLVVEGICTHYAGAESVSNHVRVMNQIDSFNQFYAFIEQKGIQIKYRHTACSAAALNYPETTMDMVRFGIAQYGFWPNRETYMKFVKNHPDIDQEHRDPLHRVMSWKSEVMSTKQVEAGEFIGYGNVYLTNRKLAVATVPIGYSHGFARNLTNSGIVLVNGKRAPVVGLVNMNLITVDITDIPNVQKGDEVVLIGRQKDKEISVASFSEISNYLNYEVLVRIPPDLPRRVV